MQPTFNITKTMNDSNNDDVEFSLTVITAMAFAGGENGDNDCHYTHCVEYWSAPNECETNYNAKNCMAPAGTEPYNSP